MDSSQYKSAQQKKSYCQCNIKQKFSKTNISANNYHQHTKKNRNANQKDNGGKVIHVILCTEQTSKPQFQQYEELNISAQ